MHVRVMSAVCAQKHTHTHTHRSTYTHPYDITYTHVHTCSGTVYATRMKHFPHAYQQCLKKNFVEFILFREHSFHLRQHVSVNSVCVFTLRAHTLTDLHICMVIQLPKNAHIITHLPTSTYIRTHTHTLTCTHKHNKKGVHLAKNAGCTSPCVLRK